MMHKGKYFGYQGAKRKELYKKLGYDYLRSASANLFYSPYGITSLREYWADKWFSEIFNDWWHPGGSIMQGAGSTKKISLANCTVVDGL